MGEFQTQPGVSGRTELDALVYPKKAGYSLYQIRSAQSLVMDSGHERHQPKHTKFAKLNILP